MKNYKDLQNLINKIEEIERCEYEYGESQGLFLFIYDDEIISFYDYIDEKNYCSDYDKIYKEIEEFYSFVLKRR